MTKKAIITWIGVVSGLITILLVFDNPFQDKAKLVAYAQNQEIVNVVDPKDRPERIERTHTLKLTIKNSGELVAKDVYINAKDARGFAVLKQDSNYKKIPDSTSIYLDRLEPGAEVELYFWGSFYFLSSYNIESDLSISSPDSGKAEIRADIPGDNFIWYVEKYFIFFVIAVVLLPLLIVGLLSNNSTKEQDETENELKSELELLNYAWSIDLLTEEEFQSKGKEILKRVVEEKE